MAGGETGNSQSQQEDEVEVAYSVTIRRPVDEVFGFVGNPNSDPIWGSLIVESAPLSPGPVGIGATFQQTATLMGTRITMLIEVTDYEPGRLLRYRASRPFPIEHCRTVEPTPEGSRLTFVTEIDVQGKFHFAAPFLRQATRRQMEVDLEAIKALMEAAPRESSGVPSRET